MQDGGKWNQGSEAGGDSVPRDDPPSNPGLAKWLILVLIKTIHHITVFQLVTWLQLSVLLISLELLLREGNQ
jgi:hypothetical protein